MSGTAVIRESRSGEQSASTDRGATPGAQFSSLRHPVEAVICLFLAVVLFRTFEVEGYMISTGSMAPSLLGHHKRVVCPACGHGFAFGIAYTATEAEKSVTDAATGAPGRKPGGQWAACPNCGESSIDVGRVPRNRGDQLLVHKNAYRFRPPQRWEVVVFRNPHRPTQNYVKRVAGLPGETVQITGGDVYADGTIQRKSLETQRSMRLLVHDHSHSPGEAAEWRPRWVLDSADGGWKASREGFIYEGMSPNDRPKRAWLSYRHWIRSGGTHETAVSLETFPGFVRWPDSERPIVRYDAQNRRLVCIGALTRTDRDRLLAGTDDESVRRAIHMLYEHSHVAPITDAYGYNRARGRAAGVPVRDLMIAAKIMLSPGEGQSLDSSGGREFVIRMTDGRRTFDCVFDAARREARLHVDNRDRPVCEGRLPPEIFEQPVSFEMSLMDRRVLAAVGGKLLFPPVDYPASDAVDPPPRRPVRFGARGMRAQITALKLYRDIYYTRGRARNGVDQAYRLGSQEYFVLGDNSPVSSDSRNWPDGAVPGRLLIGKPLVVHLPSKPGRIRIGGWISHIRIPDLSRIRYIH